MKLITGITHLRDVCGTGGAHFCSGELVQVGRGAVTSDHKQISWVGREQNDTMES